MIWNVTDQNGDTIATAATQQGAEDLAYEMECDQHLHLVEHRLLADGVHFLYECGSTLTVEGVR